MEAAYAKSGSHDTKMEDGAEVVINSPSSKFLLPATNNRRSGRPRKCSACLGPIHDGDRYDGDFAQ